MWNFDVSRVMYRTPGYARSLRWSCGRHVSSPFLYNISSIFPSHSSTCSLFLTLPFCYMYRLIWIYREQPWSAPLLLRCLCGVCFMSYRIRRPERVHESFIEKRDAMRVVQRPEGMYIYIIYIFIYVWVLRVGLRYMMWERESFEVNLSNAYGHLSLDNV